MSNTPWVKSIVLFFTYLGWALYGTGLVVSVFECGIEYQSGRGSIKDTALNNIKGFLAVGLFSTVPVELYKLSVSLQSSFTAGITGLGTGIDTVAGNIISQLSSAGALEQAANAGVFGGIGGTLNPIMEAGTARNCSFSIRLIRSIGGSPTTAEILSYSMSNELLTIGNTAASIDELYLFLTNLTAIEYIRNCMPDTPGLAVWKSGHIGVYIGNGEVVEAMGTKYGVVKTKLAGRGWSAWLQIPYISYITK